MKDLIKRIRESNLEDEELSKEVMITLLTKIDSICQSLNKPHCKCKTDPTKLKNGDVLIGGKDEN